MIKAQGESAPVLRDQPHACKHTAMQQPQGNGSLQFGQLPDCLPGVAPYAISKAGVEILAKVLAKEEQKNNIRVNVIACSLVETEMGRRMLSAATGKDITEVAVGMPFGRVGQPEDVGNLCSFLCSEEGGYISGQTVYVDGGARPGIRGRW